MAQFTVKMLMALSLGAVAVASSAAIVQAQSRSDALANGEAVTYSGVLYAGETVYASCDEDCTDLDINLYDAVSGDLVASDTELDANPVVVAPYDGEFFIEVVMASCSVEPCATWTESEAGF
jgi:hypothetical protein